MSCLFVNALYERTVSKKKSCVHFNITGEYIFLNTCSSVLVVEVRMYTLSRNAICRVLVSILRWRCTTEKEEEEEKTFFNLSSNSLSVSVRVCTMP